MTQRNVESVIGRVLTDEELRRTFLDDPEQMLSRLTDGGVHLTPSEIDALTSMDSGLWHRVADEIDPRLRKAALRFRDRT